VLKIRPLDTLFTSYDEPFWVDIESDRDTTIDVYIYGYDYPFTSISVTKPYTRAQVWSENPIASNPTNQVHKIIFKDSYTGEQVDVWIAYLRPRMERVELRPGRGNMLAGTVTQMAIIGDLVFYRRMDVRRFALLDGVDHTKVFHEFYGVNENADKFYFVERQDRIRNILGGNTDLYLTLNPVDNVLVTVEYDIPALAPIVERMLPAVEKNSLVFRAFMIAIGGATAFILRYPIGVARFITKALGINTDIVGVSVAGNRLRVTYLVDGAVIKLLVIGLAALAGTALGYLLITSMRDVLIDREKSYRIAAIFNALAEINRERTRILSELINYARQNNLSPEDLAKLIDTARNMYETLDIEKALKLAGYAGKLEDNLKEESDKKWLYAIGGAGVGALIAALVRGR
jgi:hypothetical protein